MDKLLNQEEIINSSQSNLHPHCFSGACSVGQWPPSIITGGMDAWILYTWGIVHRDITHKVRGGEKACLLMKSHLQGAQICLSVLFVGLHLVVELLLSHPAEVVVLLQGLVQYLPLVLTLLSQLLQHQGLLGLWKVRHACYNTRSPDHLVSGKRPACNPNLFLTWFLVSSLITKTENRQTVLVMTTYYILACRLICRINVFGILATEWCCWGSGSK